MAEDIIKENPEETADTESAETENKAAEEGAKKKKRNKEAEKLKSELDKLKEEFESYKQSHLRVLAEYDNFRKRSIAEKTQSYGNGVADALSSILPVADNIDRALAQENASAEDMKKGVEMIANQFTASFEKLSLSPIGEIGEKFDPELHNAVSHIDSEELGENEIAAVFQKGYKLGDKVIRHAMVQVAN